MRRNICLFFALIMFLIYSCEKNTTSSNEIEGDYIFIEMLIFSSARELEGHCAIGDDPHTGTDYDYNHDTKALEYWRSPQFPINNDLQMVFGMKHIFFPLAGAGGALVKLNPVYFIPDYLNWAASVSGIDTINTVSLDIYIKSFNRTIKLPVDSTFIKVIKTIEEGVVEESLGDTCIWEYTDSLVITNYGLNPKENIKWKQFP
ncbi:hypothetical protein ISS37_01240 [candidate division KSB1 bacterium]|nr:hypothetical protein [candidate division KSB1 bacterium]